MFNIGDKVVYPMHGAGVIEAIEEKEIMGDTLDYYKIKMPIDDVEIMVPTTKAKSVGMREIVTKEESKNVFEILSSPMKELSIDSNWNKRYSGNVEKIKSGSLDDVAQVFKELSHRHLEKGLSLVEKKMLTTSKNIILSEMTLASDEDKQELSSKLESLVSESFEDWCKENDIEL